jgi:predicted aminopeptidase
VSLALCCLFAFFGLVLTGCETCSYYAQAIHGECQILHRRRPISTVLEDSAASASLKQKLQFVLDVRVFAEKQLGLPANGHYLGYADLGRPYAVWNVHAAPEFSLSPKSWWYPVVGRLEYRGYFSEQKARHYARRLQKQGYDVYVAGVTAYSTLGWFHDPVLNTFINEDETALAELLFHELAHQRLFVSGDTDFNEAFATAVAEEGLRRWLERRSDATASRNYEVSIGRTEEFVKLVLLARKRLQALYEQPEAPSAVSPDGNSPPNDLVCEKRRAKEKILEELKRDYKARWGEAGDYNQWFRQVPNNAQLNTVDTYYSLVPAFRQLLRDERLDLNRFYESVRALARLKKHDRHLSLARLQLKAEQSAAHCFTIPAASP